MFSSSSRRPTGVDGLMWLLALPTAVIVMRAQAQRRERRCGGRRRDGAWCSGEPPFVALVSVIAISRPPVATVPVLRVA
jgi:hypothetical protein